MRGTPRPFLRSATDRSKGELHEVALLFDSIHIEEEPPFFLVLYHICEEICERLSWPLEVG